MDTVITKLNKLIALKAEIITSLLDSLEAAEAKYKIAYMANKVLITTNELANDKIKALRTELQDAKDWWRPLDEYMGRLETEERSDEVSIAVEILIHRERTLDALRINKLSDSIPDNVATEDEEARAEADDIPF